MTKRLTLLLIVLAALLAACNVPGVSLPDDGPPVAVSEEAATSLEEKVRALPTSGSATLTVTQEEVTSFLALRALTPDLPLQQPQVYFKDDGKIVIRGQLTIQERSQPMRIEATPSLVDGQFNLDVTDARVGPIPVPAGILDQVEGALAEAILAGQRFGRLSEVSVGGGTLTVTGERGQ